MKLVLEDSQGRADVTAGQAEFLVQLFSIMLKNDMQTQKFSEHMIFINPIKREFIRDKSVSSAWQFYTPGARWQEE